MQHNTAHKPVLVSTVDGNCALQQYVMIVSSHGNTYLPHANVYSPREDGRLLVNGNEQMEQFVSDL